MLASRFFPGCHPMNQPRTRRAANRSVGAGLWTLGGFGLQRVVRLGGNLLLTRLLFPEAFGLMALVSLVREGLEMFSDFGVNASVVQDERGEDPTFLDTAWTLNVLRGLALWLGSLLLASPIATMYGQPELSWLIPVTCSSLVIGGFASPALFLFRRRLEMRPLVVLESSAQIIGLAAMVVCALLWHSVTALAIGNVVTAVALTIGSYWIGSGPRPRIRLHAESSRRVIRFGRWILIATAMTFFGARGDLAVLGRVADPATIGCFSIALALAGLLLEAGVRIDSQVLFPALSRTFREAPARLRSELLRSRLISLAVFLPPTLLMMTFGREVVGFLYDPRYAPAGWMLQVLACGAAAAIVNIGYSSVPLSTGDSYRHMLLEGARGVLLVLCSLLGAWWAGVEGLVFGAALSRALHYPLLAGAMRTAGTWHPGVDAVALSLVAGVAVMAFR